MLTQFGITMRALRGKREMSASELADKIGISRAYLSAIENGKRKIPSGIDKLVTRALDLSEEENNALRMAMFISSSEVTLDMAKLNEKERHIIWRVLCGNMTYEQTETILKILEEKE